MEEPKEEPKAEPEPKAISYTRAAILAANPCSLRAFDSNPQIVKHESDPNLDRVDTTLEELAEKRPGSLLWLASNGVIDVTSTEAVRAIDAAHGPGKVEEMRRRYLPGLAAILKGSP